MKRFLELFTETTKKWKIHNPCLCQFWLTVDKLKVGQADSGDHTEHDGKNATYDGGRDSDEERPHFREHAKQH